MILLYSGPVAISAPDLPSITADLELRLFPTASLVARIAGPLPEVQDVLTMGQEPNWRVAVSTEQKLITDSRRC